MRQEEGFKLCLDIKINRTLPWLLYSNTLVASDVQLSWFLRFAMELFIPYPLASNSIWLSRSNNCVVTKHQMPLGMNELRKFALYEMVNLKNKIGLF
jgi:hypothetical protein